jgi:hypothetical protein
MGNGQKFLGYLVSVFVSTTIKVIAVAAVIALLIWVLFL